MNAVSPILGPVVALAAWSLLVMLWMYATRFPAMRRAGISLKGRVGTTGRNLDGVVEDHVQWKAHNYNHLMEQPTVFYAVALSLAVAGEGDGANLWFAWAYVGLRVVHSLVQATVNVVIWRFVAFAAASLTLVALTASAVVAVCRHL